MNHLIVQSILHDRQIAYAITDRALSIIEAYGASDGLQAWMRSWLGKPLTEVVPELIGSEDVLADVLSGKTPRFQIPWVNRELPDQSTVYLTMIMLPCRDDAGRIVGLIHIIQDVTEMGSMEQRLTQHRNELRLLQEAILQQNLKLEAANAELRRLDEVKSAFVSIAAHELRSPLTSISGYLEMLLDGDVGELADKQGEYLRIIDGSARRLLRLTKDLLDVTRIEAGRIEITLKPTDLLPLIELIMIELTPQLNDKSQRLTLRTTPDLPRALCDPIRAAQVIGNLLNNASKFSPPAAEIILTVTGADEDGFLEVRVADEGVGIAEDERQRLFEPFYRAGSAVKAGVAGTGLGLYIARSLTELHGGRLWFESTPGQGSVFHVTFPAADGA